MSDTAAIEAEGLVKHYGKTRALNGLDLTVARGTVYGLLGPNGAGKTTAVRVLATLLRADGGRARVLGHDVTTQAGAVRRVIGLTGQYAALDEYLTGRSNLVTIGELSRLTGRAARRRADELLEQFDLTDAAGRAVKTYSGGMRRRLDLAASLTTGRSAFSQFLGDVWVLTRRSLARIRREPETLSDVTIQPVMFVLMFAYVFGGAIGIPGGGNYHAYLIGGMLGMGLAQTAPGTAVAVVSDMGTGLIDRFRSLPMSRAAVLTARTFADLLTQVIGAAVVALVGLAIGWRIENGVGPAVEAFALALLFGYAFTWAGVCLGMVLRSAETAQQAGFIIFLPLTFISSAFVPTQGMPGWLQPVAEWNPMSSLAAACRQLFGNPNPAAAVHAWPAQHPELAVICWSAAMLVVFAPLAVHLYRTKAH